MVQSRAGLRDLTGFMWLRGSLLVGGHTVEFSMAASFPDVQLMGSAWPVAGGSHALVATLCAVFPLLQLFPCEELSKADLSLGKEVANDLTVLGALPLLALGSWLGVWFFSFLGFFFPLVLAAREKGATHEPMSSA